MTTVRTAKFDPWSSVDHLDQARRWFLQRILRVRGLAHLLRSRDRRLALQATVGATLLFALTISAPALLFAVGPLVFGVAHVASDVRYLVIRRRLPRALVVALVVWGAALMLLHAVELTGRVVLPYDQLDVLLAAVGVAGALFFGTFSPASTLPDWRRFLGRLLIISSLALWASTHAQLVRLGFAHAHNLVAIVLWLVLFRRRRVILWPALVVITLALLLCATGIAEAWARFTGGLTIAALPTIDFTRDAAWMAPGASASGAIALTLAYVYLQSIHYAVWLQWLPQDDMAGQGTLSFRMSLRSLRRDFGQTGILVITAATLAVGAGAWWSVSHTRSIYLALASFHGYLELALLTYFLLLRRSIVGHS